MTLTNPAWIKAVVTGNACYRWNQAYLVKIYNVSVHLNFQQAFSIKH